MVQVGPGKGYQFAVFATPEGCGCMFTDRQLIHVVGVLVAVYTHGLCFVVAFKLNTRAAW